MTNVLLVCNAGMSTGILAKKMEELGGGEVKVSAVASGDYKDKAGEADVILVGPQIRFMAEEIEKNVSIPVLVIDFRKYGIMDAKGILEDMYKGMEG